MLCCHGNPPSAQPISSSGGSSPHSISLPSPHWLPFQTKMFFYFLYCLHTLFKILYTVRPASIATNHTPSTIHCQLQVPRGSQGGRAQRLTRLLQLHFPRLPRTTRTHAHLPGTFSSLSALSRRLGALLYIPHTSLLLSQIRLWFLVDKWFGLADAFGVIN